MKRCLVRGTGLGLVFTVVCVWGAPDTQLLKLRGRFNDSRRAPLTDTLPVRFSVWDTETPGGHELWQETQMVPIKDNTFQVVLGRTTPMATSLFAGGDRWLEMQIGNNAPIQPRRRIPASYGQAPAETAAVTFVPTAPALPAAAPAVNPPAEEAETALESQIDQYQPATVPPATPAPAPAPAPRPVKHTPAAPVVAKPVAPITVEHVKVERLDVYQVKTGDTLKSIAQKLYKDSARWVDLYYMNKDRLGPLGNVVPGQTLVLPKLGEGPNP